MLMSFVRPQCLEIDGSPPAKNECSQMIPTVYAWDIVDIFFAKIVASLPALAGFLDQSIKKVKAMASGTSSGLLSWFGSTKSTNRSSRSDDAKLSGCKPGHSFQESQREDMSSALSPQYEKPIQHQAVDIESSSPITEL